MKVRVEYIDRDSGGIIAVKFYPTLAMAEAEIAFVMSYGDGGNAEEMRVEIHTMQPV